MEKVTKVFYDPLLRDREQIRVLLLTLPIGSAHPVRGELLVHSTQDEVTTIDISMHPDDYFTNSVSLGDLGEQVLGRMKLFPEKIGMFNDEYQISQAPSSSFEVPIVNGLIHIFAVSVKEPTYYDLCVGDSEARTCCFKARNTFKGMTHSGDCNAHNVLLQHIQLNANLDETPHAVFVSGYHNHALHQYKKRNPLVLVANHSTKTLYIVPVPLDTATIGQESTLCCPLVIKKNASNDTLLCSILPTPAIDKNLYCSGSKIKTPAFAKAIDCANSLVAQPVNSQLPSPVPHAFQSESAQNNVKHALGNGRHVLIATHSCTVGALEPFPSSFASGILQKMSNERTSVPQIVRFGKGIKWVHDDHVSRAGQDASFLVLPCILGGIMEGPMLLAIGEPPKGVPFANMAELHHYYRAAKSVVVFVDEKMTDNARNVATTWRLNGLFILQAEKADTPNDQVDVIPILDKLNINAMTALAGPQSLVLVQLGARYFFYRGLADPQVLDTSNLNFGQDVTRIISDNGLIKMAEQTYLPSWPRLVDLAQNNLIHLPMANRMMKLEDIKKTFREASMSDVMAMKTDIAAIVSQLQILLPQDKLQEICQTLIKLVSKKLNDDMEPLRHEYSTFVIKEFDPTDNESIKRKNMLLSRLRKMSQTAQNNVQWLTVALGNVVSNQTTSSRTHDLKRLARQTAIHDNVATAKSMTFERLSETLEEHASQMGAMVVNINTGPYLHYISNSLYLEENDPSSTANTCFLDPRILYLEGLDAGIVLQASQSEHSGPLVSLQGRDHPILALPYLNKRLGSSGSMLAWICWDEFVQLGNPYRVRWMEKCNDPNIAAVRIIMRSTLSQAVSSRSVTNLQPSSKETGQLMGALLMMTMRKLAETRSTVPKVSADTTLLRSIPPREVELVTHGDSADTSTLLMRGLFGNLLTFAGSGIQPISYVWQLFGKVPTFEIPTSSVDWSWYENTTRLLPYSGWPLDQYKVNVVGLLDKLIFRMMIKNEQSKKDSLGKIKGNSSLQHYCKARNIQLLHSRTIITILEKMLTGQNDLDCQASAQRLLQIVPGHVPNQTQSYNVLYRYIQHLAEGGKQRSYDNMVAANVFTKRSGAFREGKQRLAEVISDKDLDRQRVMEACQQLLAARAAVETAWGLEEDSAKMQNSKLLQQICDASLDRDVPLKISKDIIDKTRGDAEITRKPWQIGDKDEFGEIEKLDWTLVTQVLGEGAKAIYQDVQISAGGQSKTKKHKALVLPLVEDEFSKFREISKEVFLQDVKIATSMKDVCQLMGITVGAMEAFVAILVPDHKLEVEARLPLTFRQMVLMLLGDRCRDAEKVKPTKMLLGFSC